MTGPIANPRDVPGAHALIRRLCALQAHVVTEVLGHDDSADCFCGDEGFWPYDDPDDYRNAGKAIDFIEDAVLAAIAKHRAAVMSLPASNSSKRPRTWWWEIRMTVPLTVSMPRAVYGWIKPWLVRRGVEIKRAGVRAL